MNPNLRVVKQATHVPIELPKEDQTLSNANGKGIENYSFIKSLQPSRIEFELLPEKLFEKYDSAADAIVESLYQMNSNFNFESSNLNMQEMEIAASFNSEHLAKIGETLVAYRKENLQWAIEDLKSLYREYSEAQKNQNNEDSSILEGGDTDSSVGTLEVIPPTDTFEVIPPTFIPTEGTTLITSLSIEPTPSIGELTSWFENNGFEGDERLLRVLENLRFFPEEGKNTPIPQFQEIGMQVITRQEYQINAFLEGLTVTPIGHLHLERLEFAPEGEERGELVYTAPLAPEETFNFTHTEWSLVQEELERYITDELEETSELGVTEKNDISQSVETINKVDHEFKADAKVSGQYGKSIKFEASTGYKLNVSDSRTAKSSVNKSKELTRKATSRAKQEHKQSFKVSRQSREEDSVTRTIKNPHNDKVMRVDYYRMMRKWKVRLLRYGVRLTYDINVPQPGSDLLQKIQQIQHIDAALNIPFETYFNISREDLMISEPPSSDYWKNVGYLQKLTNYGLQFGVKIELPKNFHLYTVPYLKIIESYSKKWSKEEAKKAEVLIIEIPIPKEHKDSLISYLDIKTDFIAHEKEKASNQHDFYKNSDKAFFEIYHEGNGIRKYLNAESHSQFPIQNINNGKVLLRIRKRWVDSVAMKITISFRDHFIPLKEWLQKTYLQLREAAKNQYDELRDHLLEIRDRLEAELGEEDTLSLRRLEREEMMKNVLRWMFGPGFHFILPSLLKANGKNLTTIDFYNDLTRSVVSQKETEGLNIHQLVLQHGRLIQFLHQAVEWENMIYLLYPYFWSNPAEWQNKLYLQHPDPIHRAFLKASSARVVLPIRPGFEEKFMAFISSGKLEIPKEGKKPPYVTIAQELQNFAKTNYQGIRSANPENSTRPQLTYRQQKTWEDMQEIIEWVEKYKKEKGTYPTSLTDIDNLSTPPSPKMADRKDAWGNAYYYKFPGDFDDFDLASWGANGQKGFDEQSIPLNPEDEDITSWAEASVIGTWYEYTPTSALDIDVKTKKID